MSPSRLAAMLALLSLLVTLPSPTEGTFSYLTLPAALMGFPVSQLALGMGLAGVKIAIASRLLKFLFGFMFRRPGAPERGISVRKEFVHVPARDLQPRPLEPAVQPELLSAPPLPPHPPLHPRAYASPFGLPQPYELPGQQTFVVSRSGLPPPPPVLASGPLPAFQPSLQQFAPPPPLHFVVPPLRAVTWPEPVKDQPSPSKTPIPDAQPATGGTFDQILKIAQSPAVSKIVSNNPDLIVRLIQGVSGVKPLQTPLGTAHSIAGLTASKIGDGDIEALLNFVRQDPNLVRNIVRADPGFVPSLVNNLLGITGQKTQEPTPAPPPNFSGFDFKKSNNDTDAEALKVPANVPIDTGERIPSPAPAAARETGRKPPAYPARPYSLLGYPTIFYPTAKILQSPFEAFKFPIRASYLQPPAFFSRDPWLKELLQRHLKHISQIGDAYRQRLINKAIADKQQDKSVIETYGSFQQSKPNSSYQTPVTTKLSDEPTVDVYGSPRKSTFKSSYHTEVTAARPDEAIVLESNVARKAESSYHAPITTESQDRPLVQNYGSSRANKPKSSYQPEVTTALPRTENRMVRKDKPKSSYETEVVTTELPIIQAYGSGTNDKPGPSYEEPQPSTDVDVSDDPIEPTVEIVVVTEEPELEQDLPTLEQVKGDVHAFANQDDRSPPPTEEAHHVARPSTKQVADVFVPVTGKFRLDSLRDTHPKENVAGPPAALLNLTAHPVAQEKEPAPKDLLKRPYQIETTTKLPISQAHETGRNYKPQSSYGELEPSQPSYDKPLSSTDTDMSKDPVEPEEQLVAKPVVEQDLPSSADPKGDVYASTDHSDHSSLPPDEIQSSVRPPVRQAAVPPPVRRVFVPVTGKVRFDPFGTIGPGENAGSFPAFLYDPTDLDTGTPKDSEPGSRQAAPKPRNRRSVQRPVSLNSWKKARHMDSRKCVFKMVCYIGANDQSFGRYGENVSLLFSTLESTMGSSKVAADYSRAFEVGRTHGGEGCRIKYNTCPMTVVDLVSLSANFG